MGVICKSWKNVVLNTPRAWRLDVLHRINEDYVSTWLERAGMNQTIRLIVPQHVSAKWLDIVFTHPNRMVYLRLHDHFDFVLKIFPRMTKLDLFEEPHRLRESVLVGVMEHFSLDLYPSFTTLNIVSMRRHARLTYPGTPPPPITTLTLECMYPHQWKCLLVACASTIVVLTLSFPPNCEAFSDSALTVLLKLAALTLRADRFDIQISTPQLTFLHLHRWNPTILWSIDTSHVTTLFIESSIPGTAFSFPALERILLNSYSYEKNLLGFIINLASDDTILPRLSQIAASIDLCDQISFPYCV